MNELRPAVLGPDCGRDVLFRHCVRIHALLILGAGAVHGVQLNIRRLLCRNRHGPVHGARSVPGVAAGVQRRGTVSTVLHLCCRTEERSNILFFSCSFFRIMLPAH